MTTTENLTPAQTKAVWAGGTNNAVIGQSLVKKGIFRETFGIERELLGKRFVPVIDAAEEKKFAETMKAEEDATPTSDAAALAAMTAVADREAAEHVAALHTEYQDADDTRREEIAAELAYYGEDVPEVRDPAEKRYAHITAWTDENLEVKYGILSRRIVRRTLLRADRLQAERHCQIVENELLRRGIQPGKR